MNTSGKTLPGIDALLAGNSYPGRGIAVGTSPNGKKAVAAYFPQTNKQKYLQGDSLVELIP